MERITLFRHPDCAKCRRIARVHKFFDWLNRVAVSTAEPPTGPLVPGQIAVLDHATGKTFLGVGAVRRIFRTVPAYVAFLPLLRVPAIARAIDRQVRGCPGGGCEVRP